MLAHITLIIAHSHPFFRIILQNMVRSHPGLCVLAVVATGPDLLKEAAIHQPDIILVDIALPGLGDLDVLQEAGIGKQAKLIFSWDYHQEQLVRKAMDATGPGYIVRHAPPA